MLPTIYMYGVLKRFKQRGTVENKRSGRPSLLTPRDTRKLYAVVKSDRKRSLQEVTNIVNEYIGLDQYLIELFKYNCMKQNITSVL